MARAKFYLDEMMPRAVAEQLNLRGYPTVLANDVGMTEKSDPEHLTYASEQGFVLVTFDRKFAGLTAQIDSPEHAGFICLSGTQDQIGHIVRTLIEFAEQHTAEDAVRRVFWL
jgi:predicted nuclease of predicted toxin-antitoxin system